MKPAYVFLGGAAVGALAALLLAPDKGAVTRARVLAFLKERGLIPPGLADAVNEGQADINALMEQITAEIKEDTPAEPAK